MLVPQPGDLVAVRGIGDPAQRISGLPGRVGPGLLDALVGVAFGLLASAFARSEFQAVQFMPLVATPQILLCGLFVPREQMAGWLEGLSNLLPLTWSVDALMEVGARTEITSTVWTDLAVVLGVVALALALGAATLRRRTP